ncbi:hypothetical protein KP509_03G066000 [Ceratopteris richardii]|nr:hypothetical protein KP509_03G066000 [Ceratopteris richardii]
MFRVRPKFLSSRVRRQKSLTSESSRSAHSTPPARQAVQKFLEGPSQSIGRDDAYQEECKELLRKLSAKGNRVPGFV